MHFRCKMQKWASLRSSTSVVGSQYVSCIVALEQATGQSPLIRQEQNLHDTAIDEANRTSGIDSSLLSIDMPNADLVECLKTHGWVASRSYEGWEVEAGSNVFLSYLLLVPVRQSFHTFSAVSCPNTGSPARSCSCRTEVWSSSSSGVPSLHAHASTNLSVSLCHNRFISNSLIGTKAMMMIGKAGAPFVNVTMNIMMVTTICTIVYICIPQ